MFNSRINEHTPQTQRNVSWIPSKTKLETPFLNSGLEISLWESGPKIDPATGVTIKVSCCGDTSIERGSTGPKRGKN